MLRELFLIPARINPGSKRIASTGLGYRAKHTCLAFTIYRMGITLPLPLHGSENEPVEDDSMSVLACIFVPHLVSIQNTALTFPLAVDSTSAGPPLS